MAPERRGRALILDTSVLREAATWNAVNAARMRSLAGDLRFLRTGASYPILANFRKRFLECIVPGGVFVELYYWIRELGSQEVLWGQVARTIEDLNAGEVSIRWSELDRNLLVRFGPVDASLVWLGGHRDDSEILTDDGDLVRYCRKSGLRASGLRELMAGSALS